MPQTVIIYNSFSRAITVSMLKMLIKMCSSTLLLFFFSSKESGEKTQAVALTPNYHGYLNAFPECFCACTRLKATERSQRIHETL